MMIVKTGPGAQIWRLLHRIMNYAYDFNANATTGKKHLTNEILILLFRIIFESGRFAVNQEGVVIDDFK